MEPLLHKNMFYSELIPFKQAWGTIEIGASIGKGIGKDSRHCGSSYTTAQTPDWTELGTPTIKCLPSSIASGHQLRLSLESET